MHCVGSKGRARNGGRNCGSTDFFMASCVSCKRVLGEYMKYLCSASEWFAPSQSFCALLKTTVFLSQETAIGLLCPCSGMHMLSVELPVGWQMKLAYVCDVL